MDKQKNQQGEAMKSEKNCHDDLEYTNMKSQSITLKKDQVYYDIPIDLDTSKDIVSSRLNGEAYNKCFLVRMPPQLQESMSRPDKIYLFIPPDTFKEDDELEIIYEN